jgi:hypothetical protein
MNIKPGDSVQITPEQAGKYLGVTMTVESVARTNALLNVPGDSRRLKCPISLLIEPQTFSDTRAAFAATVSDALYPGTVVRLKSRPGSLYVVIAQNSAGHYRAAKLGGDGGRYLTRISRSAMEVVDVAEMEAAYI